MARGSHHSQPAYILKKRSIKFYQSEKATTFKNKDLKMAAEMHLPDDFTETEKYPAIVCIHPAGGVKLPSIDPLMLDKNEALPGDENRVAFIEQNIAPIAEGFAKYTNELLYGEVWLRAELSSRSRSLATVCAMYI